MILGELIQIMCGDMPPMTDEIKYKSWKDKKRLIDASLENFTKRKVEGIIKMKYDAETLGEKWTKVKEYEKKTRMELKEAVAKEHNNGYVFVTINPNSDCTLQKFETLVDKFAKRNMFKSYRYVFEQRGTTKETAGQGLHAHILLKRNLDYKPCLVTKNSKNTFKNIAKVENPAILNIQHIGADFAKDKDEYMTQVKDDEIKAEKQVIDRYFRDKMNLKHVYGSSFDELIKE